MPTILRFRGFNFMIFVEDHEPAHVLEGLLSGSFGNARWGREWSEAHQELTAA